MSPTPEGLVRVTSQRRCPVCGGIKFCLVSKAGGDDPEFAYCPRRATSEPRRGELGWLHRLRGGEHQITRQRGVELPLVPRNHRNEAERLARAADHDGIGRELGLAGDVLKRMLVGWCSRERCSTWPEFDSELRVVGINRRFPSGEKRLRKDDRVGLYLPTDLPRDLSPHQVLLVEGGSDAAAGLGLGAWTIGRHSALSGFSDLKRLVRSRRPAGVTVVADRDSGIGLTSAHQLARVISPYCRRIKVILPPEGIKDLREWCRRGASLEEIGKAEEALP